MTIALQNVEIGYLKGKERTVVLSNINNILNAGELTCLLGANGVGKSTLLRTLAGFQPKLKGKIDINQQDINSYSHKALAKVISIVLTKRPQVYNMTSFELVATGRTPYTDFWGKLTPQDDTFINQAFEEVGIRHLKKRYINTLSDGERQKVMIAKALVQDTPIILLDEPTAFLDYPSKVEIMQLLVELAHTKDKTILLSTHDMELAFQVADNIWLFDKEKQLITGTPEDLAINHHFASFFDHTGICFDSTKGLFIVEHPKYWKVHLSSISPYAEMVRRALARNNIQTTEQEIDGMPQILLNDNSEFSATLLLPNHPQQTVYSIQELLNYKFLFKVITH